MQTDNAAAGQEERKWWGTYTPNFGFKLVNLANTEYRCQQQRERPEGRVEHARRPMSLASEERSQFATIWWLSSSTVTKSNRDCAKLFTPT